MSDKTKLLTLKDIQSPSYISSKSKNTIREEARKWIKELKYSCVINEHDPNEFIYCGCKDEVIDWIKHFFNLENEE